MKKTNFELLKIYDVRVEVVDGDVIVYAKPVIVMEEEELRNSIIRAMADGYADDLLDEWELDSTEGIKQSGTGEDGYYAILKWEKKVVTDPVAKDSAFKRTCQWLTNRPTDWYKGYLTGVVVTTAVAFLVARATR